MATALQQPPAKFPLHQAAQQQQQVSEDSSKSSSSVTVSDAIEEYLDLPSPAPAPVKQQQRSPTTTNAAVAAAAAAVPVLKAVVKASGSASTAAISNAEMQTLAASAPIAAASLAHGPPPPGSSPEILFRYYLASELRRMGSPFDDSVIDKYVKQHTKTLDAARKAGSTTPTARATSPATTPQPTTSTSIPSDPVTAAAAQGLGPMSVISTGPSPFKLTAPGMSAQATASIDTAAIFSSAAVGSSMSTASIDPHMVQLMPMSRSSTTASGTGNNVTASPATLALPSGTNTSTLKVKDEFMTPKVHVEDLMDESDNEHTHKDEDDDEELEDDDDEPNSSNSTIGARKFGNSTSSPSSILGVPASLASISEDMRPSAEEYRKLSSKEKRQLRNKISARNFRTRRKEYIGQLEDQIADRDQIIEGLRLQVAKLTTTNRELNEEVKTLKARTLSQTDVSRILDALQQTLTEGAVVPPASSTSSVSMPMTSAVASSTVVPSMAGMAPPALPQAQVTPQVSAAAPTVTLPTLAGPAAASFARTPMRNSSSSTSLSDFFGGINSSAQRPGTPMQTSRPSTPLSPLFPALGASAVSSGLGAMNGNSNSFSPSLRPSLARRASPANFNMGGSLGGSSSSSVPTLGHAGLITQPNTKKDVAPNASADSFWAGSSSGLSGASGSSPFGAGANGFTPVYMTLVDELSFPPPPSTPAPASEAAPAYSKKSVISTQQSSQGAAKLAEMLMEKLRTTTTSSSMKAVVSRSDKSVTARSEVEDAFSRLLLEEHGEDVDSDAEIPPTYQEAIGSTTLLLAGPVPTYCKV